MPQYTESHETVELVTGLIDACRDTQFTFEIAAGGLKDRLLRAELLQYSGQRREFVADLLAVLRRAGDLLVDPGTINEPLRRCSQTLRSAVTSGDVASILRECERTESAAQDAYQAALAHELAPPTASLVHSQLAAIARVQHRLHRLRVNARSESN